jgi:hypothetical protein
MMMSSAITQLSRSLPFSFPISPTIDRNTRYHLDSAYDYYHSSLLNNDGALSYVASRGITPASIEKFRLGFGDRTLTKQVPTEKERRFLRDALKCSGFVKPNGHELFRGCITFPVTSDKNIIGGYGRLRTHHCKWGNTPYLYHLIEENTLFNQYALQQACKSVLLVKSPLEAVSLAQVCDETCLGLIQHKVLLKEQLTLLQNAGIKVVKVCINPNETWKGSIEKILLSLVKVGIRVKLVELPAWLDVNGHLQSFKGGKTLFKLIKQAQRWQRNSDEKH